MTIDNDKEMLRLSKLKPRFVLNHRIMFKKTKKTNLTTAVSV